MIVTINLQLRDQDAADVELLRQPWVRRDSLLGARADGRWADAEDIGPGKLLEGVADGERGDEQRHGRGPTNGPERDQLHQEREDGDDDDRHHDHPEPAPAPREEHRVGADHDQLAVGEIHQAHDAEEERKPERHQRE